MPKNRPTATDTTMPRTADHKGTLAGSEVKTGPADQRDDPAEQDSADAAHARQHGGFEQELNQDVGLAGAHGFADADLIGALGHRDQHDVHDADAAHQQADGAEHHHHQERHGGDLAEIGDHLFGGGEREVVGLVVGHAAVDAQHGPHFVQRLRELAFDGADDDGVLARVGEHLLHHAVGHQDAVVGVAEERRRGAQHGADHRELVAIHVDGLADGIDVGEEALLDVGADHRHGHAMAALFVAEEAAQVQVHLAAAA